MKSLIIFILAIFLGFLNTSAQTSLTKDEILISWTSEKDSSSTTKNQSNITFDLKANKVINLFIDSLKNSGVDSLIVYSISYPGTFSADTCNDYMYPIYSYILWGSNKKLNIKTIKGRCEFINIVTDSLGIFTFYRNNQKFIQNETIMPVILGAERTSENKINYSIELIDHEPKYSLYFIAGSIFKKSDFTQNDIENKKSLFHQYNLTLRSLRLWQLLDKKIRSIQN